MYSDWVWSAIGGFLTVWLLVASFFIWKQSNNLASLFPKSGERDIRKKFEEVLKQLEKFGTDLDQLKKKLSEVERLGLKHIQRVALSRYNPYDDTGGDQSFAVALLDEKGNGMVITSLHARSGTRIFAKPVLEGKAGQYQLSKEEEIVVKKAME
ncbi:MAG: hypothetical protein G01um10147_938 [Microgenomates group bacterium Gr01-1014_7]|nr:MAG: hypothetical protein G01um10147_938 [Microgenomates group bacterium Gr01-1014_7]